MFFCFDVDVDGFDIGRRFSFFFSSRCVFCFSSTFFGSSFFFFFRRERRETREQSIFFLLFLSRSLPFFSFSLSRAIFLFSNHSHDTSFLIEAPLQSSWKSLPALPKRRRRAKNP